MGGNQQSTLRIVGTRLCVGIGLGLVAGALMVLGQAFSGDIHPLDRWHALCVYEIIGAISGTIIGMAWGFLAAFGGDSPSGRPRAPLPDDAADSR